MRRFQHANSGGGVARSRVKADYSDLGRTAGSLVMSKRGEL